MQEIYQITCLQLTTRNYLLKIKLFRCTDYQRNKVIEKM